MKIRIHDTVLLDGDRKGVVLSNPKKLKVRIGLYEGNEVIVESRKIIEVIRTKEESEKELSEQFSKDWDAIANA